MGFGGISVWQLIIILVIVLLLFGTKRLRGLGGDLGGAIKGFKKAMTEEEAAKAEEDAKKVEADENEDVDASASATTDKEKSESK